MKAKELRALPLNDLKERLLAEQDRLVKLKSAHVASPPIENPMRIRYVRRTIARLYTLIQEKERQAVATRT